MITDEQLKEYDRLAAEATPGPWTSPLGSVMGPADKGPDLNIRVRLESGEVKVVSIMDNYKFIAAAREAVPALTEEVRRLKDEYECERIIRLDYTRWFGEAQKERDALRAQLDRIRTAGEEIMKEVEFMKEISKTYPFRLTDKSVLVIRARALAAAIKGEA